MIDLFSQPNTRCSSIFYLESFADIVNKSPGSYKLVSLVEKILKILLYIFESLGIALQVPKIKKTISALSMTCKGMALNKLLATSVDFVKTFDSSKVSEKMLYNTSEFLGDICIISGYAGIAGIARFSKITGLLNTIIDSKNHVGKLIETDSAKIKNFKAKISINKYVRMLTLGVIKHPIMTEENPEEIRKIAMIKVAKDILSLFTSIVAVLVLIAEFMVVPPIIMVPKIYILGISTIALTLNLTARIMDKTTSHKVALFNNKQLA
jgi:hypothetical protein